MPQLTGAFELFKNLDLIPAENISHWTKNRSNLTQIRNFLGNRLLYPQTIAVTQTDLENDLAILKEAVKADPQLIYVSGTKKIILPKKFLLRFPNPKVLMVTLVQVLPLKGLTTVYIEDENSGLIKGGSIYTPVDGSILSDPVLVNINGQQSQFNIGSIAVFPFSDHHLKVSINDQFELEVSGGIMGFAIDLRGKSTDG